MIASSRGWTAVALVLAIAAISTGAPFARWAAPAPAIAIAAIRVGCAALVLLIVGSGELAQLRSASSPERWLIAAAGGLLAVHFGSWIASLGFTSTAASV